MLSKGQCYVNEEGEVKLGPKPKNKTTPRDAVDAPQRTRFTDQERRQNRQQHPQSRKGNREYCGNNISDEDSMSEATIYKDAVNKEVSVDKIVEKRDSTSSEDAQISDESLIDPINFDKSGAGQIKPDSINEELDKNKASDEEAEEVLHQIIKKKLVDQGFRNLLAELTFKDDERNRDKNNRDRYEAQPSTSDGRRGRDFGGNRMEEQHGQRGLTPEEKAELIIKQAEAAKARMLDVSGRQNHQILNSNVDMQNNYVHSKMVDEQFRVVASHVDEVTKRKIENNEYVDFARLISRDRVLNGEENGGMRLVNRNRFLSITTGNAGGTKHSEINIYINIYMSENTWNA